MQKWYYNLFRIVIEYYIEVGYENSLDICCDCCDVL